MEPFSLSHLDPVEPNLLEPTSSPAEVLQLLRVFFLTGAPSLEPTSTRDQGFVVIMSKASLVIAKSENMKLRLPLLKLHLPLQQTPVLDVFYLARSSELYVFL